MKPNRILAVLIALLFVCSGATCRNTATPPTKEAVVFYSFRGTWDAAYEGYKQAQKLDLQGQLKPGKIEEVNEKWNAFRASFRLAFVAASNNWQAATPADVLKLRDDFLTLIRSL